MVRLLKSELYKLRKNHTFRACVLFLLLMVPFSIYILWKEGDMQLNGTEILFIHIGDNIPVLVMSIFISSFIAAEFHTGRIRLILPHAGTRTRFYLSKLFVCSMAMVLAHLLDMGFYSLAASIGWGFDPNKIFDLSGFAVFVFLQTIVLCAYSAIFVLTAMLTGSYGQSLAVNIFILLFSPNILGYIDSFAGTRLYQFWPGECSVLAGTFHTSFSTGMQVLVSGSAVILFTTFLGCRIFGHKEV